MNHQRKTRGLSLLALRSISSLWVQMQLIIGRYESLWISQKRHRGSSYENVIIKWVHNMRHSMWTAYGTWHLVHNLKCFEETEAPAQRPSELPGSHQNMDIWPVLFWSYSMCLITSFKRPNVKIMTQIPTNKIMKEAFYKSRDCIKRLGTIFAFYK